MGGLRTLTLVVRRGWWSRAQGGKATSALLKKKWGGGVADKMSVHNFSRYIFTCTPEGAPGKRQVVANDCAGLL